MNTKLTERVPSLDTVEWLLNEIHQYNRPLEQLREKLASLPPGSESRLDLLPEIAVAAEVLKAKLSSLLATIDAVEDQLPGDE